MLIRLRKRLKSYGTDYQYLNVFQKKSGFTEIF